MKMEPGPRGRHIMQTDEVRQGLGTTESQATIPALNTGKTIMLI